MNSGTESEWQTRRERIDKKLTSLPQPWKIIPYAHGITKKDRPPSPKHFEELDAVYGIDPNGRSKRKDLGVDGRFRKFHISDVKERHYKLDITWLKDDSLEDADELPEPQDLATEAITELEAMMDDLREIVELVEK